MIKNRESGGIPTSYEPFLVLLVEDNSSHAMLIMRTFERLGFAGKIEHAQ
ncbi:MAG: Response regulator receiver protein [Methanothrix harundinacea]|uniref:Response regulator receiver protein n=1 Tax=Methanothrix harundinacea TaxID=301375 RepID=A0A117MBN3_9EURY|nr:MAG: Response regulator receiver protein [Methanothrix harundinacea]